MQLLRSEDHATCEGAELVPVEQAFRLGRAWFANRLDLDYQPWTLDDARRHFREAGLTSPFWSS